MSWESIPGFAVLTGRNGSGKTQLLESIAYSLSGALPNGMAWGQQFPLSITLEGETYKSYEVAYIPSAGKFSGGTAASIANMPQIRQQALQTAQQVHIHVNDISATARAGRINSRLQGRNVHQVQPDELVELLGDDYEFLLDDADVTAGLAHVFVAFRVKILEAIERGTPGIAKNGLPLGPAPWDLVNEALNVAGFSYRVITPVHTSMLDAYSIILEDQITGAKVPARDLSSGEQVLLQLVLWIYSSNKEDVFPRLLLLDEPDAHLHPAMTVQFIDVITEILVKRHNIRVIMTTHSPSTVALAPQESLFVLDRGQFQVYGAPKKSKIVAELTAGLITVSKSTRFCFVEDEDDVKFFQSVWDILTETGPSRDREYISADPSIVFLPVSSGQGPFKISGGRTVVKNWVEKLDSDPLDAYFVGLIDRDQGNLPENRVFVLDRYSYENYILDPLNLFCLLIEDGLSSDFSECHVAAGDEYLLRTKDQVFLQTAFDKVVLILEAANVELTDKVIENFIYTNGICLHGPRWAKRTRGHDLLQMAQKALGSPQTINPPRLIRSLRRGRMIPKDLAQTFRDVQGS